MADRTVTVNLQARVSGYIAQMQAAGRATADVGRQGTNVARQAGLISPKLLGIGTAAAVIGSMAVSKMANFEAAMSEVRAATGETEQGMMALTEAAKAAGGATKFSAEEAAQGITNLSKAGVATSDILAGGLTGALDLAAAGSMDVADAAEIASAALVTFNLSGQDMSHVADLLAAGAGKAMGEVSDLGMALKQVGPIAAQTGLSIEETTAALSSMASRGILGSDAGTSLKSFLQRLVPESDKAAQAMEAIGLAAYDAQGNFVGLEAVAGQLREGLADLTVEQQQTALKTIFGSDAIRAAAVLYEEGADGVAEWTRSVNDAGYAAEYAATLTDNLQGDIERLTGAIDTLMVSTADGANGPLRDLVQGLTTAIELLDEMQARGEQNIGAGPLSSIKRWVVDVPKEWWQGRPEPLGGDGTFGWWNDDDEQAGADAAALSAQRYADATDDIARRAGIAGAKVSDLAGDMLAAAKAADEAAEAQDALNDIYLKSIEVSLRLSDSQINYEATLDDVTDTLKDNGKGLDITTEKGRENMSALNDLKGAALQLISTMIEQGREQDEVSRKADKMADAVYQAAREAGMGEQAARRYADQLRDVPDEVKTEYKTQGADAAEAAARDIANAIGEIPRSVTTYWSVRRTGDTVVPESSGLSSGKRVRRHSGGEVYGSGDVDATLQGGEYVIRAAAYAANRDLVRAINAGAPLGGSPAPLVGQINVTSPKPDRAGRDVIDSLAEAAYRMGGVR